MKKAYDNIENIKKKLIKVLNNKYVIGNLIVTFIYIVFLIINKAFPFGDNTILYADAKEQYINFFCYLKEILLLKKGIFMSWNLGMANGFYTTFAYYLINPINILVVFFDSSNMYICFELILYVKLILIFNAFVLYLEKVYEHKKVDTILFGIAYTYSSYLIIYYYNIMWLDVMYMLPLSVLFINRYIKKGKLYPIILSYIYMMFIQYYMGYSMIIFCSIYYIAQFWIINKFNKENFRKFMEKGIILAICTVLVVGVSMIILLPTLKQLNTITDEKIELIDIRNVNMSEIIKNFSNDFNYEGTQKLGFTFCGSFAIVLIFVFFLNAKTNKKEKLLFLGLIVLLLIPVVSPLAYVLWHGGAKTNGFYFRYSYLLIFVFLTIAFRGYQTKNFNKTNFILLCELFAIMFIIDFFGNITGYTLNKSNNIIRLIISIMMIYINLLLIYKMMNITKLKKAIFIALIIIQVLELGSIFYFKGYYAGTQLIKEYSKHEKELKEIIKKIDNPEIEKAIIEGNYSGNNTLRYNYSTFSFFSSGRNLDILKNLKKIGYLSHYTGIQTKRENTFIDMISGIKYYIIQKNNVNFKNRNSFLWLKETGKEYDVYENPYTIPFIYTVNNNLIFDKNEKLTEIQNNILNSLGQKTNYKYFYDIDNANNLLTYKKNIVKNDENYYDYTIEYEITALEDIEIYLEYSIKRENPFEVIFEEPYVKELYFWSDNSIIKANTIISINMDYKDKTVENEKIISLKKGEKKKFKINANEKAFNNDKVIVNALDVGKLFDKIDKEKENIYSLDRINKNGIEGKISAKEDTLIGFQILYDEGWHIEIDGKETKKEAIFDSFLGTKIEKGEHKVKIYYLPQGFIDGIYLSIVSLIILTIVVAIYEKNKKYNEV